MEYPRSGSESLKGKKGKQKVRRAIRPREGDKRSDITANHSRLSAAVCLTPPPTNSIRPAPPPDRAPPPFHAQRRGGTGDRGTYGNHKPPPPRPRKQEWPVL